MKQCCKCRETKPKSEFSRHKGHKDGLQSSCKVCRAIYLRNHYQNNRQYYKNKARTSDKAKRTWLQNLKQGKPCADCGKIFPSCAMDFHHVNGKKEIAISNSTRSREFILRELEKCVLLCAVCHRIRHHCPGSSAE